MAEEVKIAKLDDVKEALTDVLYTDGQAQLSGPPDKVLNSLISMRKIGGKAQDLPGWLDNFANLLEEETNVLYRTNRANQPVYSRWYEMGEDGTVFSIMGNYLSFPVKLIGSTYQTYKNKTDIDVDNIIKGIRADGERYAAEKMAFLEAIKKREGKPKEGPSPSVPGRGVSSYYLGISDAYKTNCNNNTHNYYNFNSSGNKNLPNDKATKAQRSHIRDLRADKRILKEDMKATNLESILKDMEYRKQLETYKGKQKISDMQLITYSGGKGKGLSYWPMRTIIEETNANVGFEQTLGYARMASLPPSQLKNLHKSYMKPRPKNSKNKK